LLWRPRYECGAAAHRADPRGDLRWRESGVERVVGAHLERADPRGDIADLCDDDDRGGRQDPPQTLGGVGRSDEHEIELARTRCDAARDGVPRAGQ
jgi:hypothetical protein